ncbi:MAG: ABC transporter ATP-binding protein [Acetobacteraceae bacterium]
MPCSERSGAPLLRLEGLIAGYGRIRALHGVDLEVHRGQIVALLGANGAGKTTTLKTISGLVRASAGRVLFEGDDITALRASDIARRGLVHVPEGRRILRGLSVRENLELGAFTVRDAGERQRRMRHVFGLFPILEQRQHQDGALLSGGEQQMLAMGRALMQGPKLLLLDEPSMGLAPKLVLDVMRIVRTLHDEGATVLLVEQNARLALRIADYGYVLESGAVRMQGSGETLRNDRSIIEAYLGA